MPVWDHLLTPADRAAIETSGWGKRRGYGKKPAVVVVDAQYKFTGGRNDAACAHLWQAVGAIARLLQAARGKDVPVFHFGMIREPAELPLYWSSFKKFPRPPRPLAPGESPDEFPAELTPLKNEIKLGKRFPSCFYGTPLPSYLATLGVDTLLVAGFVTSGCVRATVVDGCTAGYNVIVPEECVGDPIPVSHASSLLEMDLKYGDVEPLAKVTEYLARL